MPQISVIVPVYKVEPYLRRCVDSILAQTFTDFELILVDDGSPDRCGEICDEYAARDRRVHVIHQQNGGLSAARNAGIDWAFANSNSGWLAFVDSDDWVHPCYLEYLYRAAKENGVKISMCSFKEPTVQTPFQIVDYAAELHSWDDLLIHKNVPAIVAWNKLYAKILFDCLRYPVGKVHEDEFLTYKLLHRAETIAMLDSPLYFYFYNPNGIAKSDFSLARFDGTEALLERIRYVRRLKDHDLLGFCVKSFLYNAWGNLLNMREADSISHEQKAAKEREIKKAFRLILLQYGFRFVPPWQECVFYDFAFPHLNNMARQSVRLLKRLKGSVK